MRGAYLADRKASSPIEEYLTDALLASLAKSSATASSVNMVSFCKPFLSILAKEPDDPRRKIQEVERMRGAFVALGAETPRC